MMCVGVEAEENTRNVILNRTKNTFRRFTPPLVRPPLEGDKGGESHLPSLESVCWRYLAKGKPILDPGYWILDKGKYDAKAETGEKKD